MNERRGREKFSPEGIGSPRSSVSKSPTPSAPAPVPAHPLRAERHRVGVSQAALSQRAHVSLRCIVAVEKRECVPRYPTRKRLLRALGLPWERHREFFDVEVF